MTKSRRLITGCLSLVPSGRWAGRIWGVAAALLVLAGCGPAAEPGRDTVTLDDLYPPPRVDSTERRAAGAAMSDGPDAPYVTTPEPIIDAMLALAGVTASDVVYDLGSGDGRIPIRAAAQYGARSVGIEIRADLVQHARDRAEAAGVADRVTFRQGDLFAADLGEATVVTLYLLPAVNEALQPKLRRELPPGARVVSRRFGMPGWAPDSVVTVRGNTLYRWRLPADTAQRPGASR